ncbi:MAG: acyl-CoA dehydrogenase family protein [Acidimicrobiaceae bacterium]|nr:acyl-CoA dehydrogenase family protein [Acidimicrobiaceae bacterium]MCY3949433.1 acyl-CoA dehydrogenase family protein [Acidimicrobiaceae bacterium]
MLDVEEFRLSVRAWLEDRYDMLPPDADDERLDVIVRTPDGHEAAARAAKRFQRELHAAGFAGVDLAEEYGGRGLSRAHARALSQELMRHDTPSLRPLGVGPTLAKATLLASGSEEQKRRFLPGIASGAEQWCQLFSEPDAGSDLVSLRTSAVGDGDEWVIDGQKVWSSYAADADFGMLLARTDPDAARPHAGITMFILPMDADGVQVRPLVDVTGGRHFNEVFIEGARVAAEAVLGEVNNGWAVSSGTLSGERSGYMGGSGSGRRRRQVISAARAGGRVDDPVARQRIARVVSAERILEFLRGRYVSRTLCDGSGPAGSMLKLAAGSLEQEAAELVADLRGAAAQAWPTAARDGDVACHGVNAARQSTIAGGTHQIQQNLLGERVLGLPREPRA